ncbi:alpha/beta hydrolase [Falsibacillus albus]|uniref:Alpha/beta hydrolase n=1 Tax=Falsibacillus albus TaxID=2478915 RepID=A0A3L7JTP5_9BACI|nr:alpha/beta hydrolase [Falsibacillus albus]RLQ94096.1 alpha/beta hydrolase [Falsibacillus albus]
MNLRRQSYKHILIVCAIILGVGFAYLFNRSTQVQSHDSKLTPEETIPTVFVHGYKGTYNSFKSMMYRFEHRYNWGKRTLLCYVDKNGQITFKGGIPVGQKHPLVQVVFQNNRATIADTAGWLQAVMKELKYRYNVEQVYLVGHSMGGLVITQYLENTNDSHNYPVPLKFVAISSPFQGVTKESYDKVNTGAAVKDLKPGSKALQRLVDNRDRFDPTLEVLAIGAMGDQIVSTDSATALRNIASEDHYKESIVTDQSISHSGLHETELVDRLVGPFLWGND